MELSGETPPSSSGEQSPIHNSKIPPGHAKSPRFQTSQAGRSTETKNVSREQDSPATPISSTNSEHVNDISYQLFPINKMYYYYYFSEA